ncbi:MAG: PEP-CTERM sorting domain-containing protein [Planctomycetota bacterium]
MKYSITTWLLIFALLGWQRECNGGIVITSESAAFVSDSAVQLYSLDIFLDLTDLDDGGTLDVANFQVRAELNGAGAGTDVAIVGIGDTMSFDHPQARPLDGTSVVSQTEGLGFTANFSSPFTIEDLDGLMEITLAVQPNVTGNYSIDILTGDGNTLITDPNDFSTILSFTTTSGVISISGVPEPNTMMFVGLGLGVFCLRRGRRSVQT